MIGRVLRLAVLATAATVAFAVAPNAIGGSPPGFTLRSGTVVCTGLSDVLRRPNIACTASFVLQTPGGPTIWTMRPRGRAVKRIWITGSFPGNLPVLRYGRTTRWYGGAIRCTARRSGLTCRNLSGHGFRLSAARQVVF
jgi:hypothetical protein